MGSSDTPPSDRHLEEDALPHGASVVVYRRTAVGTEFLMLHRAHSGPDYEGDWAWTPPAGVRLPGEPIDDCARRELWEETGFELTITPTRCGSATWPTYIAEAPPGMSV